jgi:rod shape-determining protein MreD
MKTFVLYLLFTYLALSVQAVLFKGIKPDFVLVLICFYSLKYGQVRGMTYGAVSGLLIDTASGFMLGPHIISKSIAGFLVGTLKEHLFQWNILINTLVIAILSVVNILLIYFILGTFSKVSFINRSLETSIMEVVYTVIAAMILYPFFKPVEDSIGKS